MIDTFEQRVQRPQGERKAADAYYSGKKKQHTLKSQVAVDAVSGLVVDVAASVMGPQSDLKTLADSQLLERLPPSVGALADLVDVGIDKLHPSGQCPVRKPRGKPRTPTQIAFNTAFLTSGSLSNTPSVVCAALNHLPKWRPMGTRRNHTARVVAVAVLVNRRLRLRFPYAA